MPSAKVNRHQCAGQFYLLPFHRSLLRKVLCVSQVVKMKRIKIVHCLSWMDTQTVWRN